MSPQSSTNEDLIPLASENALTGHFTSLRISPAGRGADRLEHPWKCNWKLLKNGRCVNASGNSSTVGYHKSSYIFLTKTLARGRSLARFSSFSRPSTWGEAGPSNGARNRPTKRGRRTTQ